jgi:hypothetical protein
VTQEFIRRDKLDFSEWAWANKAKVLLETLADEVAEVLTENLAECLGARLRYDKELDDLFVHADLQADNINYEDGVEVRSRLVEEVDLTISNICVSSIGPWLDDRLDKPATWYVHPDDDGSTRRELECMSRTFLALHRKVQQVLDEPEPEVDKKWRAEKKHE